jgi:DNA polymerase-3 subunit gamma/tau
MVVKIGGDPKQLTDLQGKEIENLVAQSEDFSLEQMHRLFTILLKSEEEISRSPFPKVIMELALIKMATLRPLVPLDEIVDRLDTLESNLTGTPSEPGIGESVREEESTDFEAEEAVIPVVEGEEFPGEPGGNAEVEAEAEDPRIANLEEQWARLIDHIKAQNPILGSLLRYGRLLRLDDEKIEIGFEKGSFYLEKMSEEENRKQCEEVCRNVFEKELSLVLRDCSEVESDTGAEKGKSEEPTDKERHLKKEAMENPAIPSFPDKNGGEVYDKRPWRDAKTGTADSGPIGENARGNVAENHRGLFRGRDGERGGERETGGDFRKDRTGGGQSRRCRHVTGFSPGGCE